MEFKERLKEMRKQRGFSQVELAEQLGLAKSTVGAYESGQIDPSIVALKKIAQFFHVDACYLLGEEKQGDLGPELGMLVDKYQELSQEGKEMAMQYIDMLITSGYIKNNQHDVVEA